MVILETTLFFFFFFILSNEMMINFFTTISSSPLNLNLSPSPPSSTLVFPHSHNTRKRFLHFSNPNGHNIPALTIKPNQGRRTPSKTQTQNEQPQQFESEQLTDDPSIASKASGTSARGRRLLKVREEKRKREYDRTHNYPSWAKVLEDACKHDMELRAVLGDSIGNPELMQQRIEQRVRAKGRDIKKPKTGSVLSFKVSFRDFNPLDSHIWFELYGAPTDRDVDIIGSVIQSWYVMGRLGAFNSSNLQLAHSSLEYDPLYDAAKGFNIMPSSFHDIGDVEFQDNWGRVWVDLGTADFFAIDVFLNCLTVLSSEYLGIQQVVFGGRRMGDWEEGMTTPEYGYKYFKI